MEINTLECGARQIILDSADNYEILFLNKCGNEVLYAFSDHEAHSFSAIEYLEGIRQEQYRFSVKIES